MKTARVIVAPKQPDLLAAIGFWLLRLTGLIGSNTPVFTKRAMQHEDITLLEETSTLCLFRRDLDQLLYGVIRFSQQQGLLNKEESNLAKALVHYANLCKTPEIAVKKLRKAGFSDNLLAGYLSFYCTGEDSISSEFINLLDEIFVKSSSIETFMRMWPKYLRMNLSTLAEVDRTRNLRHISIPKWDKPGEQAIMIGSERVTLYTESVRRIQGQRILIPIGGPSGAGKSTVCATLASEMNDVLEELKSTSDFADLSISASSFDLDLATPTQQSIKQGQGQDRAEHQSRKTKWNPQLAYQAIERLSLQKENIIFLDLPGGDPDVITRILLTASDLGLIVTQNWDGIKVWRKLFRNFSVLTKGEIRSHLIPTERRPESLVRTYTDQMSSGRIIAPQRSLRGWDSYLSFLARALLFKYIPEYIEDMHNNHRRIIEAVWRE